MLIDQLQSCGLTKSEAQVYLALLHKKEFLASEISSIIPVGRTRIYEIIPILISKGLCTEIQKNGKKMYCAIEPKIALTNLVSFQESEFERILDEKRSIIKKAADDLMDIYSSNIQKSDSLDYIEVIKDKNQIRNKWVELQASIRYELLSFNKPPYSMSHSSNAKHQKSMLKRKVKSKGLYEYCSFITKEEQKEFVSVMEMYASMGEETRVIAELPMKMIIIDEKITMLALNDPVYLKPSITTMIITHPSFAKAQKHVFESFWENAIPLKEFKKNINNYYPEI